MVLIASHVVSRPQLRGGGGGGGLTHYHSKTLMSHYHCSYAQSDVDRQGRHQYLVRGAWQNAAICHASPEKVPQRRGGGGGVLRPTRCFFSPSNRPTDL